MQSSNRPGPTARTRLRGPIRRLIGDRGGAVAVEYALLVLPFLFIIFSTIESFVSFAAGQIVAESADDVARQIRTGSQPVEEVNEAWIRSEVCSDLSILRVTDCDDIKVDLRQHLDYASAESQMGVPRNPDGSIDQSALSVTAGIGGTINTLRVFYEWPVLADRMRAATNYYNEGSILLFANAVWRNEPF